MKITERTSRLERTVYGNGEIGIDETVREIYKWVQEQKENEELAKLQREEDRRYLRRAILTSVLAVIIPGIVSFVMMAVSGVLFLIGKFPQFLAGLP